MSTSALVSLLDLSSKIRCIDVGALSLGESNVPWLTLAEQGFAEVIGFEPIEAECEQLNAAARRASAAISYLPFAIGDGKQHTLHITNAPMTSSLYEPDRDTIDLFPNLGDLMLVEKSTPVSTRTLDSLDGLGRIDFIKMDIQGAELMALEGAISTLKNTSVIQCEVEFIELYKDQPLFADVDRFLRSQGFCFLQFSYLMGRSFKPLIKDDDPNKSICQTLWGDAIYVRDFRSRKHFDDRILKTIILIAHAFYRGFDLAHLCLEELDRRHGSSLAASYRSDILGIPTTDAS